MSFIQHTQNLLTDNAGQRTMQRKEILIKQNEDQFFKPRLQIGRDISLYFLDDSYPWICKNAFVFRHNLTITYTEINCEPLNLTPKYHGTYNSY